MTAASMKERTGPVVLALGPGPEGAALLAHGSALALSSERGLACVTVDDGGILPPEARERLTEYHELARADGASVARVSGVDKAQALLAYAEAQDAPLLVLGCRGGPRRRSAASRLMDSKRGFSVVAVSPPAKARRGERSRPRLGGSAFSYFAALAMVAAVTLVGLGLASFAGYWSAAILYLAAISLGALRLEPGPVLLAALASALAWDFLFIPPRFAMTISRPEDAFMLGLYLVVSLSSGLMTSRLRSSERLLRAEEARLSRIEALATSLAGASTFHSILDRGLSFLGDELDCKAIALLRGADGTLKTEPEGGWEALDSSARAAADRAFREGIPAGRFARAESGSEWRFSVLESRKERLGVIGIRLARDADWDESSESSLETCASIIAIALSRELGPGRG